MTSASHLKWLPSSLQMSKCNPLAQVCSTFCLPRATFLFSN
jgi:hypothetical protein